jgi:hypothetical protein
MPEIGENYPLLPVEARTEQFEQIADDQAMPHRGAGHHHDAPSGKLIAFLAPLDPIEERRVVHLQVRLAPKSTIGIEHPGWRRSTMMTRDAAQSIGAR